MATTSGYTITDRIRALALRLAKAEQIVQEDRVTWWEDQNCYMVSSPTGRWYSVSGPTVGEECNCPDAQQRQELHKGWCKHRLAVELVRQGFGIPSGRRAEVED